MASRCDDHTEAKEVHLPRPTPETLTTHEPYQYCRATIDSRDSLTAVVISPAPATAWKQTTLALPVMSPGGSSRTAVAGAIGEPMRFGPHKFTATEGLVDYEFSAGNGDLPTHFLVVEQVDGATGQTSQR